MAEAVDNARWMKSLGHDFSLLAKGSHIDDSLGFCGPDGGPYLPGTVSQLWRRLVKRVGLEGVRLHDCRHSHASLLLKAGTHPKVVQERLGHANIQTTLNIYSHVAPGIQEAAAARFDELVLSRAKNRPTETVR